MLEFVVFCLLTLLLLLLVGLLFLLVGWFLGFAVFYLCFVVALWCSFVLDYCFLVCCGGCVLLWLLALRLGCFGNSVAYLSYRRRIYCVKIIVYLVSRFDGCGLFLIWVFAWFCLFVVRCGV